MTDPRRMLPSEKLREARTYMLYVVAPTGATVEAVLAAARSRVRETGDWSGLAQVALGPLAGQWREAVFFTIYAGQDNRYSVADLSGALHADTRLTTRQASVIVLETDIGSWGTTLRNLDAAAPEAATTVVNVATNVASGTAAAAKGAAQIANSLGQGIGAVGAGTALAPSFFGVILVGVAVFVVGKVYRVW